MTRPASRSLLLTFMSQMTGAVLALGVATLMGQLVRGCWP